MKKILIILLILLTGCSQNIDSDYKDKLDSIDIPREIIEFLEENNQKLSQSDFDNAVDKLLKSQHNYISEYENLLNEERTYEYLQKYSLDDLNTLTNIKEKDIENILSEILDGGYIILLIEEGHEHSDTCEEHDNNEYYEEEYGLAYVISTNYPLIYEKFHSNVSQKLRDYLSIMKEEVNMPYAQEGEILIDLDDLVKRIINTEKYIKEHEDSDKNRIVMHLNNLYLRAYIGGLDKNPVYDYSNLKYKEEIIKHYRDVIDKHKGSKFSNLIEEYLYILEKNRFIRTIEVENFIVNVTDLVW
ncbi:hypothetical protein [Alkalithermobacter paradoxus]|uniref:Lipoprotein n=1 Tax=Alkalithermobacter paradoxus TaxID=29349 RepID=A0A1V4IBI3_9FIRM|nr:hypothetical protein CLOTH_01790 [[Clostridium] thermoalcaliphilum]